MYIHAIPLQLSRLEVSRGIFGATSTDFFMATAHYYSNATEFPYGFDRHSVVS
jgi:hypothetical protein